MRFIGRYTYNACLGPIYTIHETIFITELTGN